MSRMARFALATLAVVSTPAFAQESAAAAAGGNALAFKYLAAGLAIGLAVVGGTAGQGKAAATAYEAIGRNPQAADKLFTPLLLGLALIEFQTIMAFIIAILLVL